MQSIICKVNQCPFCGSNGFCLNRLTVINEQGVCKHLTTPDWNVGVQDKYKNNWRGEVKEINALLVQQNGRDG